MPEVTIRPDDALIVVDVQNDFLPGGALAVSEGKRIFAPIASLLGRFTRTYATRDWHPTDHSSFSESGGPWPVHCVRDSHGAAFGDGFDLAQVDRVVDKGIDRVTDGYSAFAGTNLAEDLREHAIRRVFVCGLATDYCVKMTALDALSAGFQVVVVRDACAAVNVNESDEAGALEGMQRSGAIVVESADVRGSAKERAA
ncbi:MAG: isochorismatase family protein [Candidatus Eremiobacteraeota bacterium]|nr:isochorismatase family protein [Candidatus Eremiobacteraeota bacterium]